MFYSHESEPLLHVDLGTSSLEKHKLTFLNSSYFPRAWSRDNLVSRVDESLMEINHILQE